MNRIQKALAVATASAIIGFGGFVSTTATAATNDEVADFLTSAVATQLGLTDTTSLRTIVIEAMNNGLLNASVTDAATAAVDGTGTLTAEELAALLDANLTQQIDGLEQQLIDLGVLPDPNAPVDPTDPNAPVDPTDPNAPVDPTDPNTPVDPADPEADDDDVYGHHDDDDDAEEADDDDLPGTRDHHGGRDEADDDSDHVNSPRGDGRGHESHGNGRGVGHDHHDDDED